MDSQTGFIFKVLVLSIGLSLLIKYGGPTLNVAATPVNALIFVFAPPLMVGLGLWWRKWQQGQQN